jgi:hypothetical protein
MDRQENPQVLARPIIKGAKYGAIAGLIATWSISTAIAASELELGLPISTFYAIIGISLGSNDVIPSAYLGFGLHLVTGTILGAAIGGLAVRVEMRKKNITKIFDPYRSILMGIGTGILVWLILFLPITALIIQPELGRITEILSLSQENTTMLSVFDTNNLGQTFRGIAISAIAFHAVWGAIFGFIFSSLLRIRSRSSLLSASSSLIQNRQFIGGSPLRTIYFGLVAGLVSSLAISGLILLVEKINSLPVGTFYYVLVSALTNSYSSNTETVVALGLALHLLAGSFLGFVMSIPFVVLRKIRADDMNTKMSFIEKFSSVYGIAFGFGLWLVIFLPVTFMIVMPLLNSFEFQDIMIRQRVPTGEVASATFYELLSMMDRIIYGALAFNIFYGLLTAIMLQSFSEKYLAIDNKHQRQNEADLIRGRDNE